MQIAKEKVFYEAAQKLFDAEKVLIVCDRGAIDNKAYMNALEFSCILSELKLNEIELRDTYDAVFHLVTAAKGAEEFYTLANNSARICRKVEIIQTYLKSTDNEEVRVRQRGENGNYIYYKTSKRKVTDIKRVETESRLSKEEYLSLLMEADTSKRQIRKTRYCLTYDNQYFEIDVYPFWKDKAIMEIELKDENETVSIPDFIEVIKEVTEDEEYKNASLARI